MERTNESAHEAFFVLFWAFFSGMLSALNMANLAGQEEHKRRNEVF